MIANKVRGERTRQDILKYIKRYIQQHGYPPSRREIGDGVGLNSTSSVQRQIDRMLADGMLETDADGNSPRAFRVPGMKFVEEGEDSK